MVFDNEVLEEFQEENPITYLPPPEKTPSPSKTLPNIEELRQQLRMTPVPEKGEFSYDVPFVETKNPNPFKSQDLAKVTISYEMRAFNGTLHLEPEDKSGETVTLLKNKTSEEKLSLSPGTYRYYGEFWLKSNPDRKITTSLGLHKLKAINIYNISLDRNFERELLYQIEIGNIEKQESETGKGNLKP